MAQNKLMLIIPVLLVCLWLTKEYRVARNQEYRSAGWADMGGDSATHFTGDNLPQDTSSVDVAPDSSLQDTLLVDSAMVSPTPRKLNRHIQNKAFYVGEKLHFDVKYGFIRAGTATMEVREMVTVRDSFPSYRVLSTARSTSFFDNIFKVRDSVESHIDARGIFSWKFVKKLREGGYKFDLFVDYDQLFGKAHVQMIRYYDEEPLRVKEKQEFEVPIPKYVLDILAAFYYVRLQDLEVGMPIYMSTHDNKKVYNLRVIVQKKERVKVKAGTFNCIVVQPQLRGEAIFKQKGKLWVWLTDDERKIPVLMKSAVFIGSITTELTRIEGNREPIRAQVK